MDKLNNDKHDNGTDRGHWDVMYLYLHDLEDWSENRKKCPISSSLIQEIGLLDEMVNMIFVCYIYVG